MKTYRGNDNIIVRIKDAVLFDKLNRLAQVYNSPVQTIFEICVEYVLQFPTCQANDVFENYLVYALVEEI